MSAAAGDVTGITGAGEVSGITGAAGGEVVMAAGAGAELSGITAGETVRADAGAGAGEVRFFFLGRHRPTQGSWYLTNFLQLQTHFLVGRKILSRKLLNYVFIDLGMYYVYAQNMYLCR